MDDGEYLGLILWPIKYILNNYITYLLGNPKERDTHFYLSFFQNNLADPKIASTNLLKYVTPIVSILNLI